MQCPKLLRFIGLDVHKKWMQIAMLDRRGKLLWEGRTPATPDQVRGFARTLQRTDQVALEATGNTWALVAVLQQHAGTVVVSNPLATRAIAAAKIKTDKVDARVLAHLLRCGYLPEVWRPDPQTQQWRALVRFRDRFVRRRTQLKNQVHAVFHQNLLTFTGSDLFGTAGRHWMAEQRAVLGEPDRLELDVLLEEVGQTEQRLEQLAKVLARLGYNHPAVRLLMTIPGVDYVAALSLLAAIGDIARFPTAKHLASYFGLVSRVSQSGQKCFLGPITKRGRSHGRWIAIEVAQHLCKAQGPLRQFYLRIEKRKGHNVAVVAVARKLLTVVWHMLTQNEPYRYSLPQATATKLARLRVRATGQKKKGGVAAGTPRSKHYGTGRQVRRVQSLNAIYTENDLPPVRNLPPGELAMLGQHGLCSWAIENLNTAKTIVKKRRTKTQKPHAGKEKDKNQIHCRESHSVG